MKQNNTIKLVKELVDYVPKQMNDFILIEDDLFIIINKFKNIIYYTLNDIDTPLSAHMSTTSVNTDYNGSLNNYIIITHKNFKNNKYIKNILIGKGIVFDTGGLNIKTGSHMYSMHDDKAGASAVIGAINELPEKFQQNTIGLIGFRINLPGQCFPGEVKTSLNGKKVEIVNTDAEGRLLLADLIEIANIKFKKAVNFITLATLTGVASYIGTKQYSLLMSNSITKQRLLSKGKLQFFEENKFMLMPEYPKVKIPKSKRVKGALSNSDDSSASNGAHQGYLFLKEFSQKNLIHIDMAGLAVDSNYRATGYGVKELNNLLSIL